MIARAEHLIPRHDSQSIEEFHEVIERCKGLPKSPSDFGLVHADHAPQNFRYDTEQSRLTAFDFGNCCYHWFIADLAISLSTVRRKANREQIRGSILEGYASIRSLPNNFDNLIDLFIRLRVVYVYLSRLHLWSKNRTSEQARDLENLKGQVHEKTGWNL
jgi:amicoumacin kinase